MPRVHPAALEIRRLSHGLCDALINLLLEEVFFAATFLAHGRTRSPQWIARQVDRRLERCDARTVRRAIQRLRERGLIETATRSLTSLRITAAGYRWARERVPTYHHHRSWDHRMYLITYDVPERLRDIRRVLRAYLRKIRCGPLQASVWVTPYNPRSFLRTFVRERRIPGVIVAEFGQGSVIGEGTYRDVVARAYRLTELNARYQEFLGTYGSGRVATPFDVAAAFTAILRDDPQLPFELLPANWSGDAAHTLVQRRYRREFLRQ